MRPCLWIAAFVLLAAGHAHAVLPTYDEPLRTLYLVRHGEYEHDAECDEDVGCGLVALGRQQTRLLADRFQTMDVEFTGIQSSTMTRARETADILAERFPAIEVTRHGDISECTPTTERVDIMERLDEGEAAACDAQLETSWARLFRPARGDADEHEIVVCHGNVIRWFVARLFEAPQEHWLRASIANCSLTVVQVRQDGSFKLVSFADSGHLPWSMTTYPGVSVEQ